MVPDFFFTGFFLVSFSFQHFPLYRASDETCQGEDAATGAEKVEPFEPKWDCLSQQASDWVYLFIPSFLDSFIHSFILGSIAVAEAAEAERRLLGPHAQRLRVPPRLGARVLGAVAELAQPRQPRLPTRKRTSDWSEWPVRGQSGTPPPFSLVPRRATRENGHW